MLNYYTDLPEYISNSTLGSFYDALYCVEERCVNLQMIFDFGSLVDAMITEPQSLDFNKRTMLEPSTGNVIPFTSYDWERARGMTESALNDPILKLLLKDAHFQYVFLRRAFTYEHGGQAVTMPTRCKLDILNKKLKVGADIKTTGATSQEQFEASINHFKYHRQGAVYMDCAVLDKFWYIGIGKKKAKNGKYPVFRYAIERGDETYTKGFNQYNKLGFLYKHLIYDLQLTNLTINI